MNIKNVLLQCAFTVFERWMITDLVVFYTYNPLARVYASSACHCIKKKHIKYERRVIWKDFLYLRFSFSQSSQKVKILQT